MLEVNKTIGERFMFPDVLHYLEKVLVHKILNLDVLDQRRPKDFKLVVFNTLDREQG